MSDSAFIQSLPKTETHLHFEASLPWDFLHELDPRKYALRPASWNDDFRFESFAHFEHELIGYGMTWYTSPERYHRVAQRTFASLMEQNVRYVETSIASGMSQFANLDPHEVLQAIRAAVPPGLEVRLFIGIHHRGFEGWIRPVLENCVKWDELDGIDLHGPEDHEIGDWAPRLWQRARDYGKFTKAHAGEFCGPESVRYAIDALKAQRIQHGVRASEDPELVCELAERGIGLDVCPISNLKLRVVPSLEAHPLRKLMQAGVRCTISTDDPVSFGNHLNGEYLALATTGYTRDELVRLARNGFENALVDATRRQAWLDELDAVASSAASA
ncbi:MAG: adenosine deaminase [Opitutales bacterium]